MFYHNIFLFVLQKDDILIVSYTDVGWSPYFPMISGLVTEMGGLVSHGKTCRMYSKNSNNWDTYSNHHHCPKMEQFGL